MSVRPLRASNEMLGEPLQETAMTLRSDRADGTDKAGGGKYGQEPEPDEGCRLETAPDEIRIARFNDFVETRDLVAKLRAYPANQKVAMRRHRSKHNGRPVLHPAIGLRERRQSDVAFSHGRRRSAAA